MKRSLVLEGALFIALGGIAVLFPHVSTIAIELLLGWLLVFSSLFQFLALSVKKARLPLFQTLLLAIAYGGVGSLLLIYPNKGEETITLFLALLFFLQGLYGLFMAFHTEFPPISKAWLFVSGLISICLAFFVWSRWPQDASWLLGLFSGANLILLGISYLVLGKFFRKI